MKLRKKIVTMSIAMIMATGALGINATASSIISSNDKETTQAYYTNMNGAELTKEQYCNLEKVFDKDTIATLAPEVIDIYKDCKNIGYSEKTYYIKTVSRYNDDIFLGEEDQIVDKFEYDFGDVLKSTSYSACCGSDTYETSYKKLKIQITYTAGKRTVTVTNTWKKIPKIKSYDVIALAPGVTCAQFTEDINTKSGYQKYDGNLINYSPSSSNFKTCNGSGFLKKGIGLSQNIVDSTSSSLINQISTTFTSSSMDFCAYGSYQHATSNVSLSQSKNYTINILGMGGLIYFNSSVAGYYDDMPGVYADLY